MKKLLTLEPTHIQSGLYSAVGKAAVPLWHEGQNIVFKDLGVRRIDGATEVLDAYVAPTQVRAMLQGYATGKPRVYVASNTKIQMLERTAGVWASSDIYTWPTATAYASIESWGTWLLGTNNINPPVLWKNTGAAAALPAAAPAKARILRRAKNFMMAFNTDMGEDAVEWAAPQDVEMWNPAGSPVGAGNNFIRDLEGEIVAAELLGDRIGVYSPGVLAIGTYVGSPNYWGFKRAIRGIGAISPKSIVEAGVFHYGLMQNGIFKTDGNSHMFIDDPAMQRWVIKNVNWDQASEIWGYHDDVLRAVTWYFLTVDLVWRSVSYHYDNGLMTKGNLQAVAGAPRSSLQVPVIADPERGVSFWQQGTSYRGVDISFSLTSKPLDFGVRDYSKIVQLVKVDGSWDSSCRLRVGALATPEGTPEWFHDAPLVTENYLPEERDTPYTVLEFSGSKDWYMTGLESYGVVGSISL